MKIPAGYRKTEIGIIPEDWEIQKLKSVCSLTNGRGFRPTEWRKDGLPIIRIQNLNGSKDFNFYDGPYDNKILIRKGQLLFAWSGSRGTSFGPYVWDGPQALLNYHIWKVDLIRDNLLKDFFLQLLRKLTRQIEDHAHGASALVHTQKGEMENFEFAFPPSLPEQFAISKSLNETDSLITNLEDLIAKKQKVRQAAMRLLCTGKTRLPGHNKSWAIRKLGEVAEIKKGEQLNRTLLSSENAFAVVNGGIEPSGYTNQWNRNENTITISEGGNSCGFINYMRKKFWSGGHCYTLHNLSKEIDDLFLFHFLKYREKVIMDLRVGSGLPNIQKSSLLDFEIYIPPVAEQRAIAVILNDILNEIEALQVLCSKYKLIKESMMHDLLTGRVRLA